MQHLLILSEQNLNRSLQGEVSPYIRSVLGQKEYQKRYYYKDDIHCYQLSILNETFYADTNYFVGVDWLEAGKAAIYVEPKLNNEEQVDFMSMLFKSLSAKENLEHLQGLFYIDYNAPRIEIPEQKDLLSPLLIVQFVKIVQQIVRKGLRKSYYRITENLDGKIKGKIVVAEQIKMNLVRNRVTKTVCNFQVHDINTKENQFLKLVLEFVSSYLNQNKHLFSQRQNLELNNLLSYCQPAFQYVSLLEKTTTFYSFDSNVFYKEYKEAIRIGNFILKRFSFNIDKVSETRTSTPPFWIDMSKLFELYVFEKLKEMFPEPQAVTYHDRFAGKEIDILIRKEGYKCVVDCKYKPRIQGASPSLEDKRQVVGYTRLAGVYNELRIAKDKIIKALIIYSHQDCNDVINKDALFDKPVDEYVEFYKYGISLPELKK